MWQVLCSVAGAAFTCLWMGCLDVTTINVSVLSVRCNKRSGIDSSRAIYVIECYLVSEGGQNCLFSRTAKIFEIWNYLWYSWTGISDIRNLLLLKNVNASKIKKKNHCSIFNQLLFLFISLGICFCQKNGQIFEGFSAKTSLISPNGEGNWISLYLMFHEQWLTWLQCRSLFNNLETGNSNKIVRCLFSKSHTGQQHEQESPLLENRFSYILRYY